MGWMHDTLAHMHEDPVHRKFYHNRLTFFFMHAFSEHYALPLSHGEVVHCKGLLWNRMAGDDWKRAASYRLFLGSVWTRRQENALYGEPVRLG